MQRKRMPLGLEVMRVHVCTSVHMYKSDRKHLSAIYVVP